MRVSSDKQTLILAGESTPPPRTDADRTYTDRSGTGSQLQRVTMLLVQGEFAPGTLAAGSSRALSPPVVDDKRVPLLPPSPVDAPAASARSLIPRPWSGRTVSSGAAEYARMQDLSGASAKIQLIDTYA